MLIKRSNKLQQYSRQISQNMVKELYLCLFLFIVNLFIFLKFKCGLVLEENIVRFINMNSLGVTIHVIILLIITFTIYIFDIFNWFIDKVLQAEYIVRDETYQEMRRVEPNVLKCLI